MKVADTNIRTEQRSTSMGRLPLILLLSFGVIWVLLAVRPWYRQDWLLENVIVFLAIPLLVLMYRRAVLSRVSYLMVFAFLTLHEVGAHYTYSEVPYDAWWQSITGFSLNAALGWERNHFDRLLHLLFGLLITNPMRELLNRTAGLRGAWSYALPVLVMLSMSTTYELIEWGAAMVFGGDLGMAYLGTQGDVWDAHKDMGCAALGAIGSMLFVATIHYLARRRGVSQSAAADCG